MAVSNCIVAQKLCEHTGMLDIGLVGLAIAALIGVIFEEVIKVSKAKITLLCGCLAWVALFVASPNKHTTDDLLQAFKQNI